MESHKLENINFHFITRNAKPKQTEKMKIII